MTGVGWGNGPCVGNTYAVPKVGYPSLCLQDGPLGVRYAANVSALPAGIQAASTWDRELIYQRGLALGKEAKGLGIHVQLGPVAGALGKVSSVSIFRGGEGFSFLLYRSPWSLSAPIYLVASEREDWGNQ